MSQPTKPKRRLVDLSVTLDNNPYTDDHSLAREVVEREAASVGLRRTLVNDLGGDHYLVVVVRDK